MIPALLTVLTACGSGAGTIPVEEATAETGADSAQDIGQDGSASDTGTGESVGPSGPLGALRVVQRSDDELYILQLRLKNWVLSDGIFSYVEGGALLLPLGEMARALEFEISVDPTTGRANGWFLSENRLFSLDMARQEIVIEGRRDKYDPRFVELHADDIYVDTRVLARWLPVDIDFDLSNSLVTVKSREPLEIERRLEREHLRGTLKGAQDRVKPEYEIIDTPYQWASWPFVDTSLEAGFFRDSLGEETYIARYNTLVTADLLKTNASLFLAGNQDDEMTQARLTLGRKDPEGRLLGRVGATEYAVGDIASPQMTLISETHFGRGAEVSTFPLGREGQFNRTTIIGDLPLGWDVELYRNEVLIDFQEARQDGRYEFVDVPLLFGVNVLRLEFFGPQGQRRQETRRILVGEGQVPKGKFNFRIAANQHDTGLLPVENDQGGTPNPATEGEGRFFAQGEYGLTKNLSIAGGVSSIPLAGGQRNYGTVGARLSLGGTFTELDVVTDNQGGRAGRIGMQASLPGNLGLLLEHSQFSNFISEDAEDTSGLVESRSSMRLDGVIALGSLPRVPFSLSAGQESYESGRQDTEVANRLSAAISRLVVSNNVLWQRSRDSAGDTTVASGTLLVGGRLGRASLRGETRYDIEPVSQVSGGGVTGEWYFDTNLSARLSVQGTFTDPSITTYGAGVSKRFRLASVGFTTEYATDDSAIALLTVSFGLGREPRSGSWRGSAQPMAAKGTVSARAFLDNDLDGAFGEGDVPLEGVRFDTSRGLPLATTDSDGVVLLTGLPVHEPVDIFLPTRGLEDPYWAPQPEGYSVTLRPGRPAVADFPIITTGEVDGVVYLERDGVRREVAEVAVQLVDASGNVVDTVETAFDGFYLFDSMMPGQYTVRVDPAQLARLNMTGSQARNAAIGGGGTIVSNVTFTLYPNLVR